MRQICCFYWACIKDAWRGCWTRANELASLLGGGIFWGMLFLLSSRLQENQFIEAPTTYLGVTGFTFVSVAASVVLAFFVIFIGRLVAAPARLCATAQKNLKKMSDQVSALERMTEPQFSLSFHPEAEGLERAIVEYPPTRQGPLKFDATFVRIRVGALSKTTVAGGLAFLTRLQKESADGKSLSDIRLPQHVSLRGDRLFDVYPGVLCPIDFLMCSSENNKLLVPESNWPRILNNVFNETGTYHFTITVNFQVSDSITIAVGWGGRWDKITARQAHKISTP